MLSYDSDETQLLLKAFYSNEQRRESKVELTKLLPLKAQGD